MGFKQPKSEWSRLLKGTRKSSVAEGHFGFTAVSKEQETQSAESTGSERWDSRRQGNVAWSAQSQFLLWNPDKMVTIWPKEHESMYPKWPVSADQAPNTLSLLQTKESIDSWAAYMLWCYILFLCLGRYLSSLILFSFRDFTKTEFRKAWIWLCELPALAKW